MMIFFSRKTWIGAAFLALTPTGMNAQSEFQTDVEISVVSKYMWRGSNLGGLSIQPNANIAWQGLFLNIDGNKSLDGGGHDELDVTLGYKAPFGVNIGVTDYWINDGRNEGQYFFYEEGLTPHQFEGNIGYECKYFSLQGYCMFWGDDYKINGDRAYSTYVELSVPFRLAGLNWLASAAMTPMESAGKQTTLYEDGKNIGWRRDYFYADGPACVSAAVRVGKELSYKQLSIPVFVEMHTNPYLRTATFLGGVTLKLKK